MPARYYSVLQYCNIQYCNTRVVYACTRVLQYCIARTNDSLGLGACDTLVRTCMYVCTRVKVLPHFVFSPGACWLKAARTRTVAAFLGPRARGDGGCMGCTVVRSLARWSRMWELRPNAVWKAPSVTLSPCVPAFMPACSWKAPCATLASIAEPAARAASSGPQTTTTAQSRRRSQY